MRHGGRRPLHPKGHAAGEPPHNVKEGPMLVLTVTPGERVHIGDGIVVHALSVSGCKVRVGFDADGFPILRGKLRRRLQATGEELYNPRLR